jgi:hypothetical protein
MSDRGRKLEFNNLKGTILGSPSGRVAQNLAPHGEFRIKLSQCSGLLRAAQGRNSLAQPQPRVAYSPLRLQSRVLRSQSGNGIWRGQDSGVSIVVCMIVSGRLLGISRGLLSSLVASTIIKKRQQSGTSLKARSTSFAFGSSGATRIESQIAVLCAKHFEPRSFNCLGYDITTTTSSERPESLYDNTVRTLAKSEHARSLRTRTPELEYKQ